MFDVTLVVAGQQQHDGGGGEEGSGSSPSVRMRSSTVVLRRDWQELRALHLALTELLSSSAANKVRGELSSGQKAFYSKSILLYVQSHPPRSAISNALLHHPTARLRMAAGKGTPPR